MILSLETEKQYGCLGYGIWDRFERRDRALRVVLLGIQGAPPVCATAMGPAISSHPMDLEAGRYLLVVEAQSKQELARGMQGLNIRLATTLNSFRGRRRGSGFAERYFALALTGIRHTWRTVRYVLGNGRKHGTWTKRGFPDPYSSGRWFRPWRSLDLCRGTRRSAVVDARTYVWMPYIDIDHVPGPHSNALTS